MARLDSWLGSSARWELAGSGYAWAMLRVRSHPDPYMSTPDDDTKRPLPSADEINAYLELSAARTKKRLPLAFGSTGAAKAPARDRKLRVAAPAVPLAPEVGPGLPPDSAGLAKKPSDR